MVQALYGFLDISDCIEWIIGVWNHTASYLITENCERFIMSKSDITVCITSVGNPRASMLARAFASVVAQTHQPDAIVVAIDTDKEGAAMTRQRATEMVRTTYVAYLDDDDEFKPQHLHELSWHIGNNSLIYPWFDVIGGQDPFPMHEGQVWQNDMPRQFPVTYLARVDAIRAAGGWCPVPVGPTHADGNPQGEDWDLELRLIATGAEIVHLNQRTWNWYHHGKNSSGRPDRINWDS